MRTLFLIFPLILFPSCSAVRGPRIGEIAHYDTSGWAHDISLEGNYLYVSDRQGGYLVFDRAAGWDSPRIFRPVEDVISLAPRGGRPLLAARYEGLVLGPGPVADGARVANGDIANAVVSRGDLGFAAFGSHGLVIVRIGALGLQVVSELPTSGWSHDVKLWGERALLADWNYGLRVVDIGRPETPVEIGVLSSQATAICISLGESRGEPMAALAEGHAGVAIVALKEGGRPERVARLDLGLNPADAPHPETGGWAHGVAWCGEYLFVANWKRGLDVVDASDPAHPRMILEVATRGTALGVKAEVEAGGSILVFLAEGEEGLRVYRFSPPSRGYPF